MARPPFQDRFQYPYMPRWIDEGLKTLDLGDEALNQRSKTILDRFAAKPSASIPRACRGWAQIDGAYRFFAHPRVTPDEVLRPHADATLARIAEHPIVLLPRDNTELDSSRPKKPIAGAGPLSYKERTGFFQHVQLAVTPERLPLGVIDAMTWGRDPAVYQKNVSVGGFRGGVDLIDIPPDECEFRHYQGCQQQGCRESPIDPRGKWLAAYEGLVRRRCLWGWGSRQRGHRSDAPLQRQWPSVRRSRRP